jgi:hypothetical protein
MTATDTDIVPDGATTRDHGVLSADVELSRSIYAYARANPVIKTLADIISFTSDEVLWFGLPSAVGCSLFCLRFAQGAPMGCIEEFCWDCFGSCAVGTLFESLFKWIFRRIRPVLKILIQLQADVVSINSYISNLQTVDNNQSSININTTSQLTSHNNLISTLTTNVTNVNNGLINLTTIGICPPSYALLYIRRMVFLSIR